MLPGLSLAQFEVGAAARSEFASLVAGQAYEALQGAPGSPTVLVTSIAARRAAAAGLGVTTRVVMPEGQARAVQRMLATLGVPPGPSAPWLQGRFPGAALTDINSALKCADAFCELCMDDTGQLTRDSCTKCVASRGSVGTATFRSVHRLANKTCSLCPRLCRVCNRDGTCAQCWPGNPDKLGTSVYRASAGYCRLCPALCARCLPSGRCSACKPAAPSGNSVYMNKGGLCSECTRPNCATCSTDGACAVCRAGHLLTAQRLCACKLPNCLQCTDGTTCTACKARAAPPLLLIQGRCQACAPANCLACKAGQPAVCQTCKSGFARTAAGQCHRSMR